MMMAKEITTMFNLIEERTQKNGFNVQRWKCIGYELIWRQYSTTGIDIMVTPNNEVNKYLPYIYVKSNDEGQPIHTTIQTTSYGAIPMEEYNELQRAMSIAQTAAESIELQFIRQDENTSVHKKQNIEEEKYNMGEVIFDITTCIPLFTNKGMPAESAEYDSRELYACIFEWAKEFEERHPNPGFDYLILVEEFACAKLREFFELEE